MKKLLIILVVSLLFVSSSFHFNAVFAEDNNDEEIYEMSEEERNALEEELSNTPLNYIPDTYQKENLLHKKKVYEGLQNNLLETIPSSYSSKAEGYITPAKYQNPYGSCWAFAAVGAAEANYAKNHDKEMLDLSELHLSNFIYYTAACDDSLNLISDDGFIYGYVNSNTFYPYSYDQPYDSINENRLQVGGNQSMAQQIIASGVGFVSEETMPYPTNHSTAADLDLKDSSYCYETEYILKDVDVYSMSEVNEVKKAIMKYGALAVSYLHRPHSAEDQGADFLDYYGKDGKSYFGTVGPIDSSNHAVLLVGWDDNYSVDHFQKSVEFPKPTSNGAWILKNSWNTNFGDDGFFYMSYEEGSIQTSDAVAYTIEEVGEVPYNIYQYDGGGITATLTYDEDTMYEAALFTAQNNEILSDVGLTVENTGLTYEIEIYTGVDDEEDPTSGTLVHTETGTSPLANVGYHTIPLSEEILIEEGDKFSVVIKLHNPNEEKISLPCDYGCGLLWGNVYSTIKEEPYQTFYGYSKSNLWDAYDDEDPDYSATMRIKALCKTVSEAPYTIEHYFQNIDDNNYTLDETITQEETGDVGTTVTADALSKDGFTYKTTSVNSGTVKLDGSLVIKLYYDRNTYTVTFDPDGGTMAQTEFVGRFGKEFNTPSDPVKDGYDFVEWDPELTDSTFIVPAENKTYTAKYQGKEYQITYVLNGGINHNDNPSSYICGEGVEELKAPSRANYEFEGWYSNDGTDGNWGNKITSIGQEEKSDITIYAKWKLRNIVQTPTSSIEDGLTIKIDTLVSLMCETEDAKIFYIINSNPVQEYIEPFDLSSCPLGDVTVEIYATHEDMENSQHIVYTYKTENYSLEDTDINEYDLTHNNRDINISSYDEIPEGLWCSKLINMTYTGKALTQDFRVYFNEKLLTLNTDYTVKYSNNTKVGTASVTVTGKGNYSSTFTTSFTINPKETDLKQIPAVYLVYSGKPLSVSAPKIVASDNVTLKNKTDYTYELLDDNGYPVLNNKPIDVGTYHMRIRPVSTSNYYFYETDLYDVIVQDKTTYKISSAKLIGFKSSFDYTGDEIEQDEMSLSYTINKEPAPLTKDTDYKVHHYNNKEIGTATMVIEGINDYYGSITKTFKINGIALSKAKFEYNNEPFKSIPNQTYTGEEIEIDGISLYYQSNSKDPSTRVDLEKDTDYEVSYEKNINAGTATILFTGKGLYTGTVKKTFKIIAYPLTSQMISSISSQTHLKGGAKPDIDASFNGTELVLNKDYTLSYKNNTKIGTATVTIKGKGNYSGTITKNFTIVNSDISKLDITVPDKAYADKAGVYKSAVTITDSDGKKLSAGSDYDKNVVYRYVYDSEVIDSSIKTKPTIIRHANDEVGIKDIIPIGTVLKATVIAKGNYYGTTSKTFRIVASDISKATVKIPTQYYTGKPIYLSKGDLDITFNKLPLSFEDYDIISYENNIAKGSASITIKGKGNYGGYKTIKFPIQSRPLSHTIIFDSNNGSGITKSMSILKNTKLLNNTFKNNGYIFIGWSYTPYGEVAFTDNALFNYHYNDAGVITRLYAKWSPITYSITYNLNGGINSNNNPHTYTADDQIIILQNPEKTGYTFVGWYLDSKFKNRIESINPSSLKNYTLYAKYVETIVLTMAEVNPVDGTICGAMDMAFKEKVEELSGGQIKIDLQGGGVLGVEADILDGITGGTGTVDICRISAFALTSYGTKKAKLLSLPYTFQDRDHFWAFVDSELGQEILDESMEMGLGIKSLYYGEDGFRDFFTVSTKTIESPSDCWGLHIRTSNIINSNIVEMIDELCGDGSLISISQLYESLQNGTVDGAEFSVYNYLSNAFSDVAPNLTLDEHTLGAMMTIITEEAWNKLSAEQQGWVVEAGKYASQVCREQSEAKENEALEELSRQGVNIIEITDKTIWRDACSNTINQNVSQDLQDLYNQIINLEY